MKLIILDGPPKACLPARIKNAQDLPGNTIVDERFFNMSYIQDGSYKSMTGALKLLNQKFRLLLEYMERKDQDGLIVGSPVSLSTVCSLSAIHIDEAILRNTTWLMKQVAGYTEVIIDPYDHSGAGYSYDHCRYLKVDKAYLYPEELRKAYTQALGVDKVSISNR